MKSNKILRWKQLQSIVPASRSTIWRWTKDGHFPQPIQVGPGMVGWIESDVLAWLDAKRSPASASGN